MEQSSIHKKKSSKNCEPTFFKKYLIPKTFGLCTISSDDNNILSTVLFGSKSGGKDIAVEELALGNAQQGLDLIGVDIVGHSSHIMGIYSDPFRCNHFITWDQKNYLKIWDVSIPKKNSVPNVDPIKIKSLPLPNPLKDHVNYLKQSIRHVEQHPTKPYILACVNESFSENIYGKRNVWSVLVWKEVTKINTEKKTPQKNIITLEPITPLSYKNLFDKKITCASFCPGENITIATGFKDGTVCLWGKEKNSFKLLYTIEDQFQDCITCMAFNPHNSSQFVVGTEKGTIYVYSLEIKNLYEISVKKEILNKKDIRFEDCNEKSISCLSFHPTKNSLLVACFKNGPIFIWDMKTELPVKTITDYYTEHGFTTEKIFFNKIGLTTIVNKTQTNARCIVWRAIAEFM